MPKPNHSTMERLLDRISGQWTLYIIWILATHGALRFGKLKQEIPGISTKVLTERLRMLAAIELIYRDYQPTIPPEVTYGLTDRGRELFDLLHGFYAFTERHFGGEESTVNPRI
jgi:DNA-binding HxlR family transcriptional regulator